MQKISLPERRDWRARAAEVGFTFADMHGEPYWDESSAYRFTLPEIEDRIEDPATDLHALCRAAVARAVDSEEWMDRLAIPPEHRNLVAASWRAAEPELYGRFDLAYGVAGEPNAKLLEYNADTPTALYESASFQWLWLEEARDAGLIPPGSDQFNAIHEALVERWREILPAGTDVHFAAEEANPEDYATVEALAWAAREAGLGAHFTDLAAIGVTEDGQLADSAARVIGTLFKLYPWEDMLRDDFAPFLAPSGTRVIEPPWKAILSNKGLLPLLWEMEPGHPNLLPAFFAGDVQDALSGGALQGPPALRRAFAAAEPVLRRGHVLKPLFSREGAAVTIVEGGRRTDAAEPDGYGEHPMIVQALAPLPVFDGFHPVLGAWVVGEACVGLGIREDRGRITRDLSRFKPHFIEG